MNVHFRRPAAVLAIAAILTVGIGTTASAVPVPPGGGSCLVTAGGSGGVAWANSYTAHVTQNTCNLPVRAWNTVSGDSTVYVGNIVYTGESESSKGGWSDWVNYAGYEVFVYGDWQSVTTAHGSNSYVTTGW